VAIATVVFRESGRGGSGRKISPALQGHEQCSHRRSRDDRIYPTFRDFFAERIADRQQWAETDEEANMATETHDGTALADELLGRIGQTVGDKAKVTTVFGDPVEREGVTVIPVAKARFGFGGGGGAGGRDGEEGSGGGGGGGVLVSPVGYIEVSQGTARFKRISRPADVLSLVAAAALTALAVRGLLAG
jgi:uncharacterized spore protein YtfJ